MKSLKLLLFSLCTIFLVSTFSCQKDYPALNLETHKDTVIIHDTVGVVHDTIRIHDTVCPTALTRLQILVQKDWIVDEVSRNMSGFNDHYVRNGTNTTGVLYNNMRFHFNVDGTGTYTDETSVIHNMNWDFTSADQRNMQLTVGAPGSTTYDWNMIELKDNYLHSTTMYGSNILLTNRLIQVP